MCRFKHSDTQIARLVKNDLGVEKEANLYLMYILGSPVSRNLIVQFFPCIRLSLFLACFDQNFPIFSQI